MVSDFHIHPQTLTRHVVQHRLVGRIDFAFGQLRGRVTTALTATLFFAQQHLRFLRMAFIQAHATLLGTFGRWRNWRNFRARLDHILLHRDRSQAVGDRR